VIVLLLVVRPLVRRILESEGAPSTDANAAAIAGGAVVEEIKAVPSQTSKMIDMAQVQGQVHAQSVQKVGELADGNPNETVSIIRSWLHEDAA
jgi:flagellar M-ring protein FliF